MEKKKPKSSPDDELAIVRAAAWAWYQQGSGSEGKSIREFDLTRTQRASKDTRFKLEATRITYDSMEEYSENSLLDRYEIEKISRQLYSLIESNSGGYNSVSDRGHRRNISSSPSESDTIVKKIMRKKLNGFWLRHAAGVCGSSGDVVVPRRRPSSHGSAVRFTK